ncbi:alpha/beta hydrolase [Tepidiforma flava]|uniref:Alpha/beta hydrolase n=1 Tax=Tepidiforma flava TaxID=3004094 RepID=A0ABY7M6B3_9CHLR|nr:alpha/beta hydrolase [Tepidiforma flava]WBL36054.1 alpha/beta hydrolase [Tepidiforma flava]
MSSDAFAHREATVNGIRMHYVEAGDGEPVVLLHGFPESWYSWRHQLRALAAAGYRAIAPDQRGYNLTEAKGPYDTGTLQADILCLMDHLGIERAHVVGHDWGGAIAWLLGMEHGERLKSLTVCNLPHPAVFRKGVRRPRQALRSWYVLFFQLPWLPERLLAAQGYHRLARMMIRECRPGTFTKDDIREFLAGWRRQGLGGGINWYRAALRHPPRIPDPVPLVTVPTLLIWGDDDRYLGRELTEGTEEYVAKLRVEHLPGVGHWVQQEAPDEVNRLLLDHLAAAVR